MATRKLKPTTPGQRFKVVTSFDLTASKPEKSLLAVNKRSGGRNKDGKMTMRYIGGGHKKKYRLIDFKRQKVDIPAIVKTIEYDPNRSARIALLYYADGEKRYILCPKGMNVNDQVLSGKKASPDIGNALYLSDIPLGTAVHNIELTPGKGGELARSAGSFATLVAREGKYVTLKLPSGEIRMVLSSCFATIGSLSNSENNLQKSGKAGRSRWLGRRPRTRGVAMNPVDHPMGGGEGKSSGGHPRSRNGVPVKDLKQEKRKKHQINLL